MKPAELIETLRQLAHLPSYLAELEREIHALTTERGLLRELIKGLVQDRNVRASVLVLGEYGPEPQGRGLRFGSQREQREQAKAEREARRKAPARAYAARSYTLKPGESRNEWLSFYRPVAAGALLIAFNAELRNVRVGDLACDLADPRHEGGAVAILPHPISLGTQLGFQLHAPDGSTST